MLLVEERSSSKRSTVLDTHRRYPIKQPPILQRALGLRAVSLRPLPDRS
jgi:hypothetical protein